jgi:hypothetical protein
VFDLGSINSLCRRGGAAPVHERLTTKPATLRVVADFVVVLESRNRADVKRPREVEANVGGIVCALTFVDCSAMAIRRELHRLRSPPSVQSGPAVELQWAASLVTG